jgi:predicted metal-dependent phosphoesterase TrpH
VKQSNNRHGSTQRALHSHDAVDLHLHTLASDGFWTPDTLTQYLVENQFKVAAVCDHDTQRSVVETIALGAERGVQIVPGVEVTCSWEDRQLHILIYGIRPDRDDDDARPFRRLLDRIDAELHANAVDAKDRFESAGKALPSLEEIRNGRVLWPFHVLSAAIQDKHAPNLKESAEMLVSLGGTFSADLPLGDVVDAAHLAGGLCLIAHPGRADAVGIVDEAGLDRILADHPLDGLEAHYRSYTDEQTELYRRLAFDRGLLVSCGSDSHAPNMPVNPRPWRAAWCGALLDRLGFEVERRPEHEPVWEAGMDPDAVKPAAESEQDQAPMEEIASKEAEAELEASVQGG